MICYDIVITSEKV